MNESRADPGAGRGPFPQAVGDRYRIEAELGRGGMATVYRATDLRHGRAVALKVLDPALAGFGVERFLREIEIAARLTHPHIVPLYDSGRTDAWAFYVMPLIAGESLRIHLEHRGPLALREAARLAGEMASALDYAHRQGVVHRDIKPDNILLSEGHAVITDFGIARALDLASSPTLTQVGQAIGTPGYMSPEQVDGRSGVDGRSDIYSLGCVVYEMLTGQPPFTGPSAMAVMVQQVTATPPPLRTSEPLPGGVEEAIHRALAKDPEHRFATATELARALAEAPAPSPLTVTNAGPAVPHRPRTVLPAPLTRLLGREHEVRSLAALLQREGVRLVTLFGPGGIGKTRLALEVAARLAEHLAGGVCFVALADVTDPGDVERRLAHALGIRETGDTPVGDLLREQLGDQELLLVLDNFERILDAAPVLTDLLGSCPRLKALVTSQAVLQVYGEHEYRVDPLPLPDSRTGSAENLGPSPVVALFVERARAVRPDFELTGENAGSVAEICAVLDGVPLAIELAAAHIRLEDPAALLTRLRGSLADLSGGTRDRPARQLTMRKAIAWSYDLLAPDEQDFFRRLACFAGGLSPEAAQAVAADGEEGALDRLETLVIRSLIVQGRDTLGEPRFRMLEPIRAFAVDMLTTAGGEEEVRTRHEQYFLRIALEAAGQVTAGIDDENIWFDRLERDHDNLRLVLHRLVAAGSAVPALRLAVALWRFWSARSYLREGLDWLSAALALPPLDGEETGLRQKALYAAGVLADAAGRYDDARRMFERHLELTRESGDPRALANSLNNLGVVLLQQGDLAGAEALLEESRGLWVELGERAIAALSLANLGNVARQRQDVATARRRYEASMSLFHEVGDAVGIAWSLSHLGDVARDEEDWDRAERHYRESLGWFTELRHARGLAAVLLDLSDLAVRRGDTAARSLLEDTLARYADLGDQRALVRVLELWAEWAGRTGSPARALRLAGAVVGLRASLGAPLSRDEARNLEQRLAGAVSTLGADAALAAWQEGMAMSMQEALQHATSGSA